MIAATDMADERCAAIARRIRHRAGWHGQFLDQRQRRGAQLQGLLPGAMAIALLLAIAILAIAILAIAIFAVLRLPADLFGAQRKGLMH